MLPKDLRDVLAQIETQTDLGKSSWYEVVYHNGKEWCSYAGSDTFSTYDYNVVQWKYVDEIFVDSSDFGENQVNNVWDRVPDAKYTRRLCW